MKRKKIKVEMRRGTLYLNGKLQKKYVNPPTVMEMMNIQQDTQERIDSLRFTQSPTIVDKNSSFTVFAVKVANTTEVKLAYKKAKQISPDADHIVMAYAVKQYSGYHDNGEHTAGKRLAAILMERNLKDTAIFVARIYGGQHIGPKRFLHIEKSARDAINELQMK